MSPTKHRCYFPAPPPPLQVKIWCPPPFLDKMCCPIHSFYKVCRPLPHSVLSRVYNWKFVPVFFSQNFWPFLRKPRKTGFKKNSIFKKKISQARIADAPVNISFQLSIHTHKHIGPKTSLKIKYEKNIKKYFMKQYQQKFKFKVFNIPKIYIYIYIYKKKI